MPVKKRKTSTTKRTSKKASPSKLSKIMKDATKMLESGQARTRSAAMKKAWAKNN
ncbi:MAG: hypothetical protein QM669_12365 [Siphonobacter sp.]